MATIDIARCVRVPISDAEVRRVVAMALRSIPPLGVRGARGVTNARGGASGNLSTAFVSPREIRRLNRTYRGEDRVTDILAFGQLPARSPVVELRFTTGRSRKLQAAHPHFLPLPQGGGVRGGGDIGEIVVCPSHVKQNAQRAGEPFRRELARVLVHGTLHLLGYDHATPRGAERMFHIQEQIVQKLF